MLLKRTSSKFKFMNSTGVSSWNVAGLRGCGLLAGAIVASLCLAPREAQAFNLYSGEFANNDLEINLDTTISYTGIVRTNNPSARLISPANANGSEGDLDFAHGLVSSEFEVLPILDIKDGNYGAHFSGEAYVNTSFLGTNQNSQAYTLNPISVSKSTDFTSGTRNVNGLNARVLDALVYGTEHFGAGDAQSITLKVGRQTLIWGQSLFLQNNGIAAGMAPFDVITSDVNPNAQTQQLIEPVGQVVLTYQANSILTLQGYYQFEWEHDYFEGVGAYFSTSDILDKGGQRILLGPAGVALRTKDINPPINNGQFGASVQLTLSNYDVGFYGLRYDSKAPTVYYAPFAATYNLVYPRDIWIEGTSVSTTVGPVNVAGELSFRQHMNLDGGLGTALPSNPRNANSGPLYATGDTVAAQASFIYLSAGIPFDPGGVTLDGEIGFNHVLKVTNDGSSLTAFGLVPNLASGRSNTAANMKIVVTPTYYDVVIPTLQLGFPIGFGYNIYGRSMVDPTENHGTGSINFGVTATYRTTWVASLLFNDYIGAANPALPGESSVADRNYVLLNLQKSF